MEFFKELKKREFETETEFLTDNKLRQYMPIRINEDLWISIQAGYGFYCKPPMTLTDINEYTHWEFALFDGDTFVSVSDVLPNFSSLAELEQYPTQTLYGNVPTDLVEEVYLELKKVLQVADS